MRLRRERRATVSVSLPTSLLDRLDDVVEERQVTRSLHVEEALIASLDTLELAK